MSIANEYADTFYIAHFEFKDPVDNTYIITFESNETVELSNFVALCHKTLKL